MIRKLSEDNRNQVAVIADANTITGFRLAGVPVVRELNRRWAADKLGELINEVLSDKNIRLIIITEPLVEAYDIAKFEKLRKTLPGDVIVSVIPDRAGSRSKIGEEHLRQLIRRAIGAKRA